MDFLMVDQIPKVKKNITEIEPNFKILNSKDLMIKGSKFYAIWDEARKKWLTDWFSAVELIDREIDKYINEEHIVNAVVNRLSLAKTGSARKFKNYCEKDMSDNFKPLNQSLVFANTEVKREDYSSIRLSYPLQPGPHENWDILISTLYDPDERRKIEWCIGAVVTGASKTLQKFLVLYGDAGSGKSTILDIIEILFEGYTATFDAKALGSKNNSFALEAFKNNPLVAIQHDGDLSKIEDNTLLNSLISHENMVVNEKFKSQYMAKFNAMLFMATNTPVRITDSNSGIKRRLIDAYPSGRKLPLEEYNRVKNNIKFELSGIAWHCKNVYESNPKKYDKYTSEKMMQTTNPIYNFVEDTSPIFLKNKEVGNDYMTLKEMWVLYKDYCENAGYYALNKGMFKSQMAIYWDDFISEYDTGDMVLSNVFVKFKPLVSEILDDEEDIETKEETKSWIEFEEQESILDKELSECTAQYANDEGFPRYKWDNVKTKLRQLDTTEIHYVKVPENHIVVDFDIPGDDGKKSLEKNLEAASKFPETYAELSKSGAGIHLHYIYDGDVNRLSTVYAPNVEVKVYRGNSALRRRLSKCNDISINHISSGLPLKEEKKDMLNTSIMFNEKAIRTMIKKNINKEYHAGTKPSIDYIYKILDDAYKSGVVYDVTDMKQAVLAFAIQSTHQSDYCVKLVQDMKFKSETENEDLKHEKEEKIIFYDVEVFPNLFLLNWKFIGEECTVQRMINPSPKDIEELCNFRLIGFNCRKYDNHILYARMLGYNNEQLYNLSKRIINGEKGAEFREAYNLSYTDIFDYALKKQSLKKWEIELGIKHHELGLDWDKPVPKSDWLRVAEYCDDDVLATEAVFNATQSDYTARLILAKLAKSTPNDTTNSLTTKIIFGKDRHPELVYTDLATGERSDGTTNPDIINSFPGYEYVVDETGRHNMYRDVDLGFGGYVKAEPGTYKNVALLDIMSQHPHSIVAMNCFGKYTARFKELLDARILIKHGEIDKAKHMLDGAFAEFLDDPEALKNLPNALKRPINSVYGLTSAGFDNPFRDPRNVNNIVALRGALFMKTLQDEVEAKGYTVVHIKTDSIKIADADQEIIDFCFEFARKYGYEFEHEATYDRICLVNNAVYIAKYSNDENINGKHAGEWTATGTEFQIPYTFKTLFSKEPIEFKDLCVVNNVKTAIYLDNNEQLPDVTMYEKELDKLLKQEKKEPGSVSQEEIDNLRKEISKGHNYKFVGKVGNFVPVVEGIGGGYLMRQDSKDPNKYMSVTGSKGYRWMEADIVKDFNLEDKIDISYHRALVDAAIDNINEHGNFEDFMMEELPDTYNTRRF